MAETVRAFMLAWLLSHNYQPHLAQAVIHNADTETRLQPCIIARSGSRYLHQWVGVRAAALRRFTGTASCPAIERQMEFADYELRSEPSYQCFWRARSEGEAYRILRATFAAGGRC